MALFDAVHGDAYAAVERLLAEDSLTSRELRAILGSYLTPDGAMEAEQKMLDGSWPLLEKTGAGSYARSFPPVSPRPLTTLELRWLKSLSLDPRAPLFLTDAALDRLREALTDVPPLFSPQEIGSFDASLTGDDFADPGYRQRFHAILRGMREGKMLAIRYVSYAGASRLFRLLPEKLEYSARDRRFRLHGSAGREHVILNLGRIASVEVSEAGEPTEPRDPLCREPLTVRVTNERNALERFMLEFSCFKKESTFDPDTGVAVAKVWYPAKDETEVLIRILGFGPLIRVTGPEAFVQRIRERIAMQPL